jgi:hypothetical protein
MDPPGRHQAEQAELADSTQRILNDEGDRGAAAVEKQPVSHHRVEALGVVSAIGQEAQQAMPLTDPVAELRLEAKSFF